MKTTKDYLESFENKFYKAAIKNVKSGKFPKSITDDIMKTINEEKQFLADTIKEVYDNGYKQGVEDEIKCVETSGEHANIFPVKRDEFGHHHCVGGICIKCGKKLSELNNVCLPDENGTYTKRIVWLEKENKRLVEFAKWVYCCDGCSACSEEAEKLLAKRDEILGGGK